MNNYSFSCIDAHTCGNPVRLITSNIPNLIGNNMSEKRQHFLEHYDWIRTALMLEPRGHAMMSGSFIYPPCSIDSDASILFVETSGCLPMCGHGTIGTVTAALEHGIIQPKTPGKLILDTPAGTIKANYTEQNNKITSVKIYNIASYLSHKDIKINLPNMGELTLDIAYGGNFYAIIEPQNNYLGLDNFTAQDALYYSPTVRHILNDLISCVHPLDSTIKDVTHVIWTGNPHDKNSSSKNIVFYGERAIDRSPCGTGTSARMAQLAAKNKLNIDDEFINESIINSKFTGRIESHTTLGEHKAIMPSIEGWAKVIGYNTILVNHDDPYAYGFHVL